MTVTATPARTAGSPAAAGATATGTATAGATGFGDLLAALVPSTTLSIVPGSAGAPDVPPVAPPGVCGAGPEVSVSPEDVVVGATDPELVVVGAAGDDAAGSRTGDPAGVVGAPADETAPETATDPTVESALLAQAQLAALPLLTPTVAPVAVGVRVAVDATAPADTVTAPAATTSVDATATDAAAGTTATDTGHTGTEDTGADASGSGGSGGSGGSPAGQASAPAPASTGPGAPGVTSAPTADAAPRPDASTSVTAAATVTAPIPTPPVRGEARPTDAVPGQVFPEVVRLSQSGPGTHRVTLRLDPGTLGEVRVTLTVRDGEVQVRLAAQHDAREVLAHAAPDLRRMLEQSGTVDARVAIADLTTGTTTDQSGGPGSDQRGTGSPDERGDDAARPSSYDEQRRPAPRTDPGPADAERPRDAGTRTGLDLAL